jgi:hypothetical protein
LEITLRALRQLKVEVVKPTDAWDSLFVASLWTGAVARYGRCFDATGVRRRKIDVSILRGLKDGKAMHEWIMDLRNKHVVHDYNAMTQGEIGLFINEQEGAVQIVGIGPFRAEHLPDEASVNVLGTLASYAGAHLDKLIQRKTDLLLAWAHSEPPARLRKLPHLTMTMPQPNERNLSRDIWKAAKTEEPDSG